MPTSQSANTEPIPHAHQPRWMVIALLVIFVVMIGGSTLFMLVSAFSGLETMQRAYRHAIADGYRFYSYGDASLLERADG